MSEQPLDPFQKDAIHVHHEDIFRQNPLIDKLKDEEAWTVSSNDKRPLHAPTLIRTMELENAHWNNGSPLVALTALDAVPELGFVNRAYQLRARENRVIAIDVEPHASVEMKHEVWNFPGHMRELSRNGGIHLLIEVPEECIDDASRYLFESMSVFKEPVPKGEKRKSAYEVLFNDHYITFTKRMGFHMAPTDFANEPEAKLRLKGFIDSLVALDAERRVQRELMKQHKAELDAKAVTPEMRELFDAFLALPPMLDARERAQEKTIDDAGGDASKFETIVANGIAYHALRARRMALETIMFRHIGEQMGDNEIIRVMYLLLQDIIPYRPKHDEEREGNPWLLFVAHNSFTFVKSQRSRR